MFTKHAIILVPTFLAANALADIVQLDGVGTYQLQSHAIDGILDGASPYLSTDDLATIHQNLNGWGIETDGKITLLPINTPAGLALFTLMDQEMGNGDTGIDATVGIVSTVADLTGVPN